MPAKLDRCVKKVKADLVRRYKEKYGKAPSKKAVKKFESSAWALCRESLDRTGVDEI